MYSYTNNFISPTRGERPTVHPPPTTSHVNRQAYQPLSSAHPSKMANAPDRFELFLLGDDEKKVVEVPETRIPDTSIFWFNKEDHTLGNMIRARLLKSPHVRFSGYKVPHPLEARFMLRCQTDGEITPREAVIQACKDLMVDLATLSAEFTKEWELKKMVGGDPGAGAGTTGL
ncbi:MAG: DNA-directed RNA polymerase II core subunit [Thelocarpon superellum]|nr:MAG: DNA-directed RNA polymerase II core subunit [Thelocarpon superellum]